MRDDRTTYNPLEKAPVFMNQYDLRIANSPPLSRNVICFMKKEVPISVLMACIGLKASNVVESKIISKSNHSRNAVIENCFSFPVGKHLSAYEARHVLILQLDRLVGKPDKCLKKSHDHTFLISDAQVESIKDKKEF